MFSFIAVTGNIIRFEQVSQQKRGLNTWLQTLKPKHTEYVKYVLEDYLLTTVSYVYMHQQKKKTIMKSITSMKIWIRFMRNAKKKDIKIIISDLNAKICQEEMYRSITGKCSLLTLSNDNGIKHIFCMFQKHGDSKYIVQ